MAITNIKGGSPSALWIGTPSSSFNLVGEIQSFKAEFVPDEFVYDDGQTSYVTGVGTIEAVILTTDASTITVLQVARATAHNLMVTGSDLRVFQSSEMTFTTKPTRFEGGQDVILLKGTRQHALETDFFFEL